MDENALLFFAPNKAVGDYFAIFLRDGHVVLRFRVGSHDLELYTERRYNDGKWTVISAEKNQLDGILSVIPKDGIPERLVEQMPPSAQSALPSLRHAKLFFGGVPPVFPTARFADRVVLDAFLGCVKDIQIYTSSVDLATVAHGVERGCDIKVCSLIINVMFIILFYSQKFSVYSIECRHCRKSHRSPSMA